MSFVAVLARRLIPRTTENAVFPLVPNLPVAPAPWVSTVEIDWRSDSCGNEITKASRMGYVEGEKQREL